MDGSRDPRSRIALVDVRNGKLVKIFTPANGLPADPPRALMTDRMQRLWCGTWTTGLVLIEQQADTFSIRKGPSIVEGAGIRSLYEDREGCIWIGTRYTGLVRSSRGEYKTVSVQNGLLSNAIWSIAETDHRIWCGTDVGLEVVDKETCKPLLPKSELIGQRVYTRAGRTGMNMSGAHLRMRFLSFNIPSKSRTPLLPRCMSNRTS